MHTIKHLSLAAVLVTGLAAVCLEVQAVPVNCPGTLGGGDREFTLDTSPSSSCLAFGTGNINGNSDDVNDLGWITIDKSDDGTTGTNPTALTIIGSGTTAGSFSFVLPAGFTEFVLGLKSGEGQLDPDWAAFLLPAGVTSGGWAISGNQSLSHANLYGRRGQVPEPGTIALLGLGLIAAALARTRRR